MRHVYLHVPFCRRRCSYCDFQIAVRPEVPAAGFVDDVRGETEIRGLDRLGPLETIYLGGGTPSLLPPAAIADLVGMFPQWPDAEVTIEANPEDVTAEGATAWRDAGVTRVSLGVQTFDPRVLEWMRRPHGPEAPARAMGLLRDAGFENVSVDLIFAVPPSLGRELAADLDRVLALGPDHVSAYGLTVEARTPLGRWVAAGEVEPTPDERFEDEFVAVHRALLGAGFEHYEVSNYALPDRMARHNRAYWSGVPYAGIGPGAHGLAGDERRWNTGPWTMWSSRVRAGEDPVEGTERLTAEAQALERVYLGLRTTAGLAADDPALVPAAVARARDAGWLESRRERVVATLQGWLRLDALVGRLTTSLGSG